MSKFSIRSKIIAVIAFMLLTMSGMGLLTVQTMRSINAHTVEIETNWLPSVRVLGDLRTQKDALWQRFSTKSGPDQVWYYTTLADLFSRRMPGPLADELQRVVRELSQLEAEYRIAW